VSFAEAMAAIGLKPHASLDDIQAALQRKGMKVKGLTRSQLVRLVEQLFEPKTKAKPLYVVDYWTELSPLAKSTPENPLITERFELFIGGLEVANAYSELNDPVEQRKRFEAQLDAAGVKGKQRVIDESFIEALEYGMPPAGGLGVGVDRLAMLLLNQPSIKDVVLFPLLKPQ
jgi:lysyl-tRNA synthetase class 2